jgi:hypothetical protein
VNEHRSYGYSSPHEGVDVVTRGRWKRVTRLTGGVWGRPRYYFGRVRMPWLAWAMFS